MGDWAAQFASGIRFEWGATGAARLAPAASCLVVVDVLSFSTTVSVAVQMGTQVFPFRYGDEAATAYAAERSAELAVGRRAVTPASPWSLSPAHLRKAPFVSRLVLPSPNGAAIAASAPPGLPVVAACLRNITAVGGWLTAHGYGTRERPIVVIAAGERWPDGSLRPALEDLLGAGSLISDLHAQGAGPLSAEAAAARACGECTADVPQAIATSASGRELATSGFAEDVAIATEEDACTVVPVLNGDGGFTAAR
ncbi:2-phosphosulfolactate phosphatase [Streptomyces sp. NBC_00243]|uniref:2-phosphosulfolactate phosphatase n=1 Tax=Streptomyces sp. NBC_00243 TaxID=2975688 RepID=UPI002DD7F6EE|nr:2-phosphosulfolactate phosphatase [Streptomyces sp. NBC_00243]WRZ18892.1 2-phosphosulfolactate phosphatase [Streptomyces sp. NBC_00243]